MNKTHMFKIVGVKESLMINHLWMQVMETMRVRDKGNRQIYSGIIMF
jgi:hypothetical protein